MFREQRIDIFCARILCEADAVGVTTNSMIRADGRAVMGAGVARVARDTFPGIDLALAKRLRSAGNHVHLIWKSPLGAWVYSFPTKVNWRNPSTLALIEQSTQELVSLADKMNWKAVYLPRPGCNNGGLSWSDVAPILNKYLDSRFTIAYR